MTSAISPTPARPCNTYIIPHVISLKRYGLRGKKIVRTRDIMNRPVTIDGEAGRHERAMAELNVERILGRSPRRRRRSPQKPAYSVIRVGDVDSVGPDRPEVHPERSVEDVKDDQDGQHGSRDPVESHPGKLDAHSWEKGREQQGEHGRCRDPVEQSRDQRVHGHAFRNFRRDGRRNFGRKLPGFCEEAHVRGMNDEETEPGDHGHLDQEPCDVDRDKFPPGIYGPL